MNTRIQISKEMKSRLDRYKLYHNESYNEVFEKVLENLSHINEQTRRDLKKARAEIASGKYKTHEQVGKELGFVRLSTIYD